jgi:hypothetical protein
MDRMRREARNAVLQRLAESEITVMHCILDPDWDSGDPPDWNPLLEREGTEAAAELDEGLVRLPVQLHPAVRADRDEEAVVLPFRRRE